MDTIPANVFGALVIALPILFLAMLLFWRRQKPVFFFVLAALAVGLGYLTVTDATTDVAKWARPAVYGQEGVPAAGGDGADTQTPAEPVDAGAGAQ
jgi:uncharacterized membrane protein